MKSEFLRRSIFKIGRGVKSTTRRLIYMVAYHVGIVRLFYWINRNRVVVLTYHNVIPDALFDSSAHLVASHSESAFRAQARIIGNRFRSSSWPATAGACVVTLDDGYRNQWVVAGPILERHALRAIYFVPAEPLITGKCLVVDSILKWLSYCPSGTYRICDREISIANDNRVAVWYRIYGLALANPDYWESIEEELDSQYSFARIEMQSGLDELRFVPLDRADLNAIKAAGHQIGGHSWSHLPLATLSSHQIAEDYRRSHEAMASHLGVKLYSYPYGSPREVSDEVMRQCAQAGFEWGFINNAAPFCGPDVDPRYCVTRLSLPNIADPYLIEAKLSGLEAALSAVRRR